MIGLLDVDGHNFPNLALMKLSAWHKKQGDKVEIASMFNRYDVLYKSKVFTFTQDDMIAFEADRIETGGTGYNDYSWLPDEIEHIYPDYSLYGTGDAYGFTTRGCPNKCKFCVVPDKEGPIRAHADIAEFWRGQKNTVLLDNNILASDHGIAQLEWSIGKTRVDCNQGLDARIIEKSEYLQDLLARVNWSSVIRLACDHKSQMKAVKNSVDGIRKKAGRNIEFSVYTLLTDDYDDNLERIHFLRDMYRVYPFAQPYLPLDRHDYTPPLWQRRMARWANHRAIFRTTEWEDYGRKSVQDNELGQLGLF